MAVALALAFGPGRPATAASALRHVENRPDRVVLELAPRADDSPPPRPYTLVAVPARSHVSLDDSAEGRVRIAGEAAFRHVKLVSLEAVDESESEATPLRFAIEFDPPASAAGAQGESPWMLPLLGALAINAPLPAGYLAGPAESPCVEFPPPPVPEGIEWTVKIEAGAPGRVRIPLRRIAAQAGGRWPAEIACERIHLRHRGRTVPFAIDTEGGRNGGHRVLVFDAAPFESHHTNRDAYWLTWTEAPAGEAVLPNEVTLDEATTKTESRLALRHFPTGLRDPAAGADLLYICHPELLEGIEPLAQWRRKQGMRVAVVSSESIADEFNFGRDEPEAIRRFLAWTWSEWPKPAPAYVLLVGDASSKPLAEGPAFSRNLISTFYPEGEDPPAHDDGFVKFLGDGRLPQMMLGRLPVEEPGQLSAIVDKLIAHERDPLYGPWRGRILFLVDNDYEDLFAPSIVAELPPHIETSRIDVADFPFVDHYNLEGVKISPACRDEVVRRIDEGAAAVHYVGHGGVSLLSHEKMFFWTDVARLRNHGRLPFFAQVSCRTGGFDWPERQWSASLAERLLRAPGAGALGVFAASRAIFGDEAYLQKLLFDSYRNLPSLTLGQIKIATKIPYLLNRPEHLFISSYNLIGDPASRLRLPRPWSIEAEPGRYAYGDGGEIAVTGTLPESAAAEVWIRRIAPGGNATTAVLHTHVEEGRLATTVSLPAEAEPGHWTLVAYARTDSAPVCEWQGMAAVEVLEPVLEFPTEPGGEPDLAFVKSETRFVDRDVVDGETVRIRATIENRGTARSPATRLHWRWRRSGAEETPRPVAVSDVPRLYPTERCTMDLRWDPYDVAGAIECILQIDAVAGEETGGANRLVLPLRIKTKPDLTLAEPPACEAGNGKIVLVFSIANRGEAPAEEVRIDVSIGDAESPQAPLAREIPVIRRLEGETATPPIRLELPAPRGTETFSHVYIQIETAEPVAEISKENNRFRVPLDAK